VSHQPALDLRADESMVQSRRSPTARESVCEQLLLAARAARLDSSLMWARRAWHGMCVSGSFTPRPVAVHSRHQASGRNSGGDAMIHSKHNGRRSAPQRTRPDAGIAALERRHRIAATAHAGVSQAPDEIPHPTGTRHVLQLCVNAQPAAAED
jgi:hypothetical protein